MYLTSNSQDVYEKMCEVIPGGVNSPIRAAKAMRCPPMVVASGNADIITDVDGVEYIDYCGSWGALIHGHCEPSILAAASDYMARGTTFGITTEIEGAIARKIVDLVPSIDKIRFVSTGTEATMTAVRIARGYTGRDIIIKYSGNYHGHSDFFMVQAGSGLVGISPTSTSAGIPLEIIQHTVCLPFNDIEATRNFMKSNGSRVAAIILEPVACNMGVVPGTQEFHQMLREETEKAGALLIFDEVITGFRIGLQGAQGYYGITPDLTCYGKIVGGGFPAAAVGGRAEIMDKLAPIGPVYQAGTLSGNPVAMAAGLQAITLCEVPGFYEELERKANVITKPVQELIEQKGMNAVVQQVGSGFTLFFGRTSVNNMEEGKQLDLEKFADFYRYMYAYGVYVPPLQYEGWFVSAAHTEDNLIKTRDLILGYLNG